MTDEIRQLDDLRQVAYRLAMAFGEAAQVEDDLDRRFRLSEAFHRSCASVRLSIGLAIRLRQQARQAGRPEADDREPDDVEAPERSDAADRAEPPERYDGRDRERDVERASLPILLRTLDHVADDAQALLPQAAELPTLRELLDRVRGEPARPSAAMPAPPAPTPLKPGLLRARLSGGTATLTLAPPQRPASPGLPGLTPRRSTGPPRG